MAPYLADAAGLLGSPIGRNPIVKAGVYSTVDFIDVDRFNTILQQLLLRLKRRDGRLMFALFVGMASVESLSDPSEDLRVEPEPA
jgi:hypothetical protein